MCSGPYSPRLGDRFAEHLPDQPLRAVRVEAGQRLPDGRGIPLAKFRTPFFYKFVRHPLYLGFIVAFWATPRMSVGHLLFAAVTTVYILVAIQLEERKPVDIHGEAYENYRRQVSMLLPIPKGGAPVEAKEAVPKG